MRHFSRGRAARTITSDKHREPGRAKKEYSDEKVCWSSGTRKEPRITSSCPQSQTDLLQTSPLAVFGFFLAGAPDGTLAGRLSEKQEQPPRRERIARTALAAEAELGCPRLRPPPPLGHGDAGSGKRPCPPRPGLLGAPGAEPSPPCLDAREAGTMRRCVAWPASVPLTQPPLPPPPL